MMPAVRTVGPRKLRVLQGSPEWLEARRSLITATDMAVIEGVSPWKCEQDLADEKLTGNGTDSTLVMRVGSALEDLILDAYSEQTGRKARHVRGLWVSREYPWAAASPDATAAGRLVELKWSGSRRRFADGLPEDVQVQCAWQAMVAEVDVVDVAVLVVGEDALRLFEVHRDPTIEAYLVAKAEDFRARLAAGGPFAQSLESVKRKYPRDNGAEMVGDPEMDSMVRALAALRESRKRLEEDSDAIETAIKSRMGEIASAAGHGWRITWKRTKDRQEVRWKDLADSLLAPMPEPDRAAVVGPFTTVQAGFRPFRVVLDKEDAT